MINYPVLSGHAKRTIVVSVLYIWAYFVTAYLIAPIQSAFFPTVVMSLLFLPHGLRVLAAWFYGWRSMAYLMPGALLCNLHFAGSRAFAPDILIGSAASLMAAPLAFSIIHHAFPSVRLAVGTTRLPALVATGILASLMNLTVLKQSYGLAASEGTIILLGDTTGLLAALALVRGTLHLLGKRI